MLTQPTPDLAYFRIDGTLWLADVAHPDEARAIDSGTFATSECPLPAPTGRRFAYVIRTAPDVWELRLWNGAAATIADEQTPVPSNHDRSFAWAPNGKLGFLRGDELWAGGRRIATNLKAKLAPPPKNRYGKEIDFSSDGRLLVRRGSAEKRGRRRRTAAAARKRRSGHRAAARPNARCGNASAPMPAVSAAVQRDGSHTPSHRPGSSSSGGPMDR